jgi:DNA polymerase III epsilon subunit-like protein
MRDKEDDMEDRMWVADTEGSGANPNEPIELGIVEMKRYELTGKAHVWRFRPGSPITRHATYVHGITNADISSAPTYAEQAEDVMGHLGTLPIIGHAVSVEVAMITSVQPDWEPERAYDTLKIAKRLLPDEPKHKLNILGDVLGLSEEARCLTGGKPHSALYDAVLTALLLRHFARENPERIDDHMKNAEIMAGRRGRAKRDAQHRRNRELRKQFRSDQDAQ